MPDVEEVSSHKNLSLEQPQTTLVFYDGSILSDYVSRQAIETVCQTLQADAQCKGLLVIFENRHDDDIKRVVFKVATSDLFRYEEAVIKNRLKVCLTDDLKACQTTLDLSEFPEEISKAFLWETVAAAIVKVLHDKVEDINSVICLVACLLTQEPLTELLGLVMELDDRQVGLKELSVLSHRAPSG